MSVYKQIIYVFINESRYGLKNQGICSLYPAKIHTETPHFTAKYKSRRIRLLLFDTAGIAALYQTLAVDHCAGKGRVAKAFGMTVARNVWMWNLQTDCANACSWRHPFCGLLPQLLDLNRPLNYDRCQHLIAWPPGFCHARSDNSWWLWCYLWHRLLRLLLQFVLSLADSGQATPQSFLQVQNPVKLVLQDQNPGKLGIQDVHPINHWN